MTTQPDDSVTVINIAHTSLATIAGHAHVHDPQGRCVKRRAGPRCTQTPEQLAEDIGGVVREVYEPLQMECPTCRQGAGSKCQRYDGTLTQPHPRRKEAGRGVRVIGPFVPRRQETSQ
jgi:hypothetical protein